MSDKNKKISFFKYQGTLNAVLLSASDPLCWSFCSTSSWCHARKRNLGRRRSGGDKGAEGGLAGAHAQDCEVSNTVKMAILAANDPRARE